MAKEIKGKSGTTYIIEGGAAAVFDHILRELRARRVGFRTGFGDSLSLGNGMLIEVNRERYSLPTELSYVGMRRDYDRDRIARERRDRRFAQGESVIFVKAQWDEGGEEVVEETTVRTVREAVKLIEEYSTLDIED